MDILLSLSFAGCLESDQAPIPPAFSQHQIAFYHIPNRSFGSVPVMVLGPLSVVPIGSFNMVSSTGTVPVIQVGDCPFEPFPFQYLKESA